MSGKRRSVAHSVTRMALFLAAALILSWVESVLPFQIPVPGVKLGLSNIVTVFVLYEFSFPAALLFSFLRPLLAALFLGRLSGLVFSVCGALFAVLVMGAIKRFPCFSPLSVSVAGAVAHGVGQLGAASLLMTPAVWTTLPLTGLLSAACGAVIWVPMGILGRYAGVFPTKSKENMKKE